MHCSSLLILATSALVLAAPTYEHKKPGGLLDLDLDATVNTGKVTHLVGGVLHKTGNVVDSVGDAVKHSAEKNKGWKKPLIDIDADVGAWLKERTYEHKPDHKSGGGLLDLDADVDVNTGGLIHGVKGVLGGVLHKTGNVVDGVVDEVGDVVGDIVDGVKDGAKQGSKHGKGGSLLDLDASVIIGSSKWGKWGDKKSGH